MTSDLFEQDGRDGHLAQERCCLGGFALTFRHPTRFRQSEGWTDDNY
jgi:hypothetical protein